MVNCCFKQLNCFIIQNNIPIEDGFINTKGTNDEI